MLRKFSCMFLALVAANALAVTPAKPDRPPFQRFYVESSGALVAEVMHHRFFRSVDGGAHWSQVSRPLSFTQLRSEGADAARQLCFLDVQGQSCLGVREKINYVDEAGNLYQCAGERIAVSHDGGINWRETASWNTSPESKDHCARIGVRGNVIYVVGDGIYKSIDGGRHWTTIKPRSGNKWRLHALFVTPRGEFYATCQFCNTHDSSSIQVSMDEGRTWKRQTFGLPDHWAAFMLIRVTLDAVYFIAAETGSPHENQGLYRSVDGQTAKRMNLDLASYPRDVQTGPDGAIYVRTEFAIYRSGDDGQTWRELDRQDIGW